MSRQHNLDYLRGIAAFGIMAFHYLSWTVGEAGLTAETFMARVGIYGVCIFYILSGLTLFLVYHRKMNTTKDVLNFFKKRALRILPLLWVAILLTIIMWSRVPGTMKLFLNLTGLYGFVKSDAYIATGSWSIGNELVFYAFLPLFIFLVRKSKRLMILFSISILSIFIYFTFYVLKSDLKLVDQWRNYVNPLNQVFFFLAGFLSGWILNKQNISNSICALLILVGIGLFVGIRIDGDVINLVTGKTRLLFTVCCLLITTGFFKLKGTPQKFIHKPLSFLGEASYSVYLLHPLVFGATGMIYAILKISHNETLKLIKVPIAMTLTLIAAYFVYNYVEKYFMNLGKNNSSFPQPKKLFQEQHLQ
jgi:exopolysaccharide production protein ExoZ